MTKAAYSNGGALLVGRLLVAFYFIIDGCYKTSDQAWPDYKNFVYERFNELGFQHKHIGYGALGDVIGAAFVALELFGAMLLLVGFRRYGSGILVAYILPMAFLSHKFLVPRGIDMKQFLPFLQYIALAGAIIIMGAYPEEPREFKARPVENTRDTQKDVKTPDFEENELPEFQEGSAFRQRR